MRQHHFHQHLSFGIQPLPFVSALFFVLLVENPMSFDLFLSFLLITASDEDEVDFGPKGMIQLLENTKIKIVGYEKGMETFYVCTINRGQKILSNGVVITLLSKLKCTATAETADLKCVIRKNVICEVPALTKIVFSGKHYVTLNDTEMSFLGKKVNALTIDNRGFSKGDTMVIAETLTAILVQPENDTNLINGKNCKINTSYVIPAGSWIEVDMKGKRLEGYLKLLSLESGKVSLLVSKNAIVEERDWPQEEESESNLNNRLSSYICC